MNKEDILRLARGAGYESSRWNTTEEFEEFLEYFAYSVYTHIITITLQDEVGQAIAREREACAKLCERDDSMRWSGAANAIRNRSKT